MLSRRELLASAAALPSVRGKAQDAGTIKALIKQLEADDWVDQAKAAKELARIGKPALDLLAATSSEAPSHRYWADAIARKVVPAAAPAKAPEPAAPADSGFNPGDDNVGNLMFVCNNPKHGDYEVIIKFCPGCGKAKRFFYDYEAQPAVYRCSVCRKVTPTTAMKCDKCGQTPGPRTRVRTRR